MTNNEIWVRAPAKVNLVLRVLGRRPDGYHELWSLMQIVGLEDELRLRLRPSVTGIRLHCDDATLPTDDRNLVHRAAKLVLEQAGLAAGVEIHLTKRIPVSAGLGGGSSDAAATIAGLNTLLGLGWSVETMARAGGMLGSDIPFFFFAPCALVRGRGEQVLPLTVTGVRWMLLVYPGFPIETRWAYERLDATRQNVRPVSPAHATLARRASVAWEDVIPLMENDFEAALAPTHEVLQELKAALVAAGAEAALLSGSGATVFGVFRDEASAVRARGSLSQALGHQAYVVRASSDPLPCSAEPAISSLRLD